MNKGKELLIDIIASYQDKLSKVTPHKIVIDGIDIVDLSSSLRTDKYTLGNITNELIDEVIKKNKYKSHLIFIKRLYQLRDLYLGKLVYNINVEDKEDYQKTLNTFIELLDNIINKDEDVVQKDQMTTRINILISAIKFNEIISDQDLIETMTRNYSNKDFDTNMYEIMQYVSKHNVNILSDKSLEDTINLSNELKMSTLDDEVLDILNKLEINYNELSIEYKMLVKTTPKEQIQAMYDLIRRNKAEDYGILHLIDRKNEVAKLAILLLSTEDMVKNVVDLFKDNNGDIDIQSLKTVINILLPVFVYKGNDFFKTCYPDFIENYQLFKDLNLNIKGLLNKCPVIFIVNNEQLTNVLDYFDKYKVDRKKVISKLYKVIANNVDIVISNVEIIKRYTDINEYLDGENYNLIKVKDLEKKIEFVINKYHVSDIEDINNRLIEYVFENKTDVLWGEENA